MTTFQFHNHILLTTGPLHMQFPWPGKVSLHLFNSFILIHQSGTSSSVTSSKKPSLTSSGSLNITFYIFPPWYVSPFASICLCDHLACLPQHTEQSWYVLPSVFSPALSIVTGGTTRTTGPAQHMLLKMGCQCSGFCSSPEELRSGRGTQHGGQSEATEMHGRHSELLNQGRGSRTGDQGDSHVSGKG